jgi:hypothetical protein
MSDEKKLHSQLLSEAGKRILKPMGLLQKGRSRFWRDDRQWWLIGVEFQPSSWTQGSYLNVGCTWLWSVKSHFSYDIGGRAAPYTAFQSEKQFRLAAEEMAQRAVEEVIRYRCLFPSVISVCDYYLQHKSPGFWQDFNAAIACALSGEDKMADLFFSKVIESDAGNYEWVKEARLDATRLRELSKTHTSFRQVIVERVMQTRALQKLPAIEYIEL